MKIITIALNTFRETVRDKILYVILLFALGFALVSTIVSAWSISQEEKIIQDFGLVIIVAFSLLISIFIGIGLIYKEVERKTIYTILAKPVSRGSFIAGKFAGMLLTLLVTLSLMGIGFCALTWLFVGVFNVKLLLAAGLLFFEMAIVIACALFFSTFTSPVLSAILTLFVFVAGNFSADVKVLGPGVKSGMLKKIIDGIFYIVPNFDALNIHSAVVHNLPLDYGRIGLGILYSIAYCGLLLIFTTLLFRKQDLK